MNGIPSRDLDEILARTETLQRSFAGARVLVTGGTGFFGRWLLESWVDASQRLGLERTMVVVARDPDAFALAAPNVVEHRSVEIVRGDVLGPTPVTGSFDACVHAATAASLALTERAPDVMRETIVDGTAHVLEWLAPSGRVPMLFTSSGAVYGEQPASVANVAEEAGVAADLGGSVYAEGKAAAERLCAEASGSGAQARIARCFAFAGPFLPLDAHFAFGNFVADAVAGRTIVIKGDGTPVRSYMYPTDLVVWLLTILVHGEAGRPYNVGSERGVDLRMLATMIGARGGVDVEVRSQPVAGGPSHRYVPSTARAHAELGLVSAVELEDALDRTLGWAKEERRG
jgi:dTDP-glucose 4,6-dehydratase